MDFRKSWDECSFFAFLFVFRSSKLDEKEENSSFGEWSLEIIEREVRFFVTRRKEIFLFPGTFV